MGVNAAPMVSPNGHRKETLLQDEPSLTRISFPLSLAPYERRVIELLRNSKDKRARKLAKKRVRISIPNTVCI
jgi:hypothetical protein